MGIQVNIEQARFCIVSIIKEKLVPLLAGSPGTGKSDLIRHIADDFNLYVIDLRLAQCDPTDLLGFPTVDEKSGKAFYRPMATFPLEGDELPINKQTGKAYDGWLLFLDELPHADRAVQKAAYKLVLDRMIGQEKLHSRVAMVAAGNLDTDQAFVEEMSTAMQSRLIHLELAIDNDQWLAWAVDNGIDHRISSFIKFKPQLLHAFDPEHSDKTFACPRTWEFANRLIRNLSAIERQHMPLLAGTLSEGVAREFTQFTKIYERLLTFPQIISDPEGVTVPTDPSMLFALSGSIAHQVREDNIEKAILFISRMPAEFQVLTMRDIFRHDESLLEHPESVKWCIKHSDYLF